MSTFRAIRIDKAEKGTTASFADLDDSALMEGDVDIRVSHSSLNFKDGLAITGKSPVVRRFPMVPGIDLAGVVEASRNAAFKPGDRVLVTGCGLGETHLGGYAQRARVNGAWVIPIPGDLSPAQAMAIGTAGFTAMVCVMTLEKFGVTPADGPAIVTGAAGGVGSIAVHLLKKVGWHVIASTGRPQESAYLKDLGADEIIDRKELSEPGRPLGKERWAAGVDTVGSHTLANVLAMTKARGAISCCGLAQGMDLPVTVAPFILRNVSLLGVDCNSTPRAMRVDAWNRLARQLDRKALAGLTAHIPFDGLMQAAQDILDGKVRGRIVVDLP